MLPKHFNHFIKKTQAIWQHDKMNESNQQMLSRISIKFLLLFFIALTFDVLLDWLLTGIHGLTELIHLLMEAIEYSFEIILEHTFHTSHYQSEIIIINTAIFTSLYGLYRFYFYAPKLYHHLKRTCLVSLLKYKRRQSTYWHELELEQKANLVSCYLIGLVCFLFLMTL